MTTAAWKPLVIYDFAPGYMHRRLLDQAVRALREYGLTQQEASLEQEMRAYMKLNGRDPQPRHMLSIFTKYVNVEPEDLIKMEDTLGKKLTREWVPLADEIPPIVWITQDWLDHFDPEEGQWYRQKISVLIESATWTEMTLLGIVATHLRRARTNTVEARAFANPRPELQFSDRYTV